MDYELITVESEEGVGIVTLNRPEKRNAINNQLNVELQEAVKQLNANDEIGCVVLTGAGKRAFSAGGDIRKQRKNDLKFTHEELDTRSSVRSLGSYEISACSKPIIGMMNVWPTVAAQCYPPRWTPALGVSAPVSGSWLPLMGASTVPGHYPTR